MPERIIHIVRKLDINLVWLIESIVYHLSDIEHNLIYLNGTVKCVTALQAAGINVVQSKEALFKLKYKHIKDFTISYDMGIAINRNNIPLYLEDKLINAVPDFIVNAIDLRDPIPNYIGIVSSGSKISKEHTDSLLQLLHTSDRKIITNFAVKPSLKKLYGKNLTVEKSPINLFKALFNMSTLICTPTAWHSWVTRGAALGIPIITSVYPEYLEGLTYIYTEPADVVQRLSLIESPTIELDDQIYQARLATNQNGMRTIIDEFKKYISDYNNTET